MTSNWHWKMSGVAPTSGNTVRDSEEIGTVKAECAGEVFHYLVQHGWWDSFDQREEVTITVSPAPYGN